MAETLQAMMARHAGPGRVVWIGLRTGRRMPMQEAGRAEILAIGIEGDRRALPDPGAAPGRPGRRAVTLLQAEHLPVIRALARAPGIGFATLRRNIAVEGIALAALKGRAIRVGTAVLRVTGACAPCSRMEEAIGPGGYTAMRGHGGVTAEVLEPGRVALGDAVEPVEGAWGRGRV